MAFFQFRMILTTIISQNRINQLILVIEMHCVFTEVWTVCLNVILISGFKVLTLNLNLTDIWSLK